MGWPVSIAMTMFVGGSCYGYMAWERRVRSMHSTNNTLAPVLVLVMLGATSVLLALIDLPRGTLPILILLVLAGTVDAYHLLIPNRLLLTGLVICFISVGEVQVVECLIVTGALVGMNRLYERWRGQVAMGGGDVKLFGFLALFVGWESLIVFYIAAVLIVLGAMCVWCFGRCPVFRQRQPVAPYAAMGFALVRVYHHLP